MSFAIKKCTPVDLDLLIQIARKTFVDAFEKHNNPEDFKEYVAATFEKTKMKSELENKNSSFYLGYQEDDLVGYFKLNQNEAQTDIKASETIELERIYVLEGFQGKKIGLRLLQETLQIASKLKKDFLWLGVWEDNTDAIRFYQKHGFSKFGTHPYYVGKDKQTDWLMRYDLSNFQQTT